MLRGVLTLALMLLIVACFTPSADMAMLTEAAEPVAVDAVRVVDGSQTEGCTAIVQLEEPASDREQAVQNMQRKAAGVGADALVLEDVREKTSTGNQVLWGSIASSDEMLVATGYRCGE